MFFLSSCFFVIQKANKYEIKILNYFSQYSGERYGIMLLLLYFRNNKKCNLNVRNISHKYMREKMCTEIIALASDSSGKKGFGSR